MDGAALNNNQKAQVFACTHGQIDLVGVSRQMRRLFRSLGCGGHKDALATKQESALPHEVLGEQDPPRILRYGHKNAAWEGPAVTPEEWEASLALRKAGGVFKTDALRLGSQ